MNDKDFTASLAKNTLDDIPTPKSDAKDIIGLVKSAARMSLQATIFLMRACA